MIFIKTRKINSNKGHIINFTFSQKQFKKIEMKININLNNYKCLVKEQL
jgi:hypothetical protein